jgi:LysM repeat protein
MDGRRGSPARLLAPLALIAFVLALFLVVATSDTSDDSDDGGDRSAQRSSETTDETETTDEPEPRVPGRFYTVETGDTLAAIAEEVGVPVNRLLELNPELDPQALVSGQRIRLRE